MPKIIDKNQKYFCDVENCQYSKKQSEKFFTKCKYLNQHHDKVHAEKTLVCPKCGKGFGSQTLLKAHEKSCGKKFTCSCGIVYSSNEALLTHKKRTQHTTTNQTKEEPANNNSSVVLTVPVLLLQPLSGTSILNSTMTQTDQSSSHTCTSMHVMAAVALSELASGSTSTSASLNEASTQTADQKELLNNIIEREVQPAVSSSQASIDGTVRSSSPWLGSSIETQTTDEDFILRPVNLCDIQTQTAWTDTGDSESQTAFSSFLDEPWEQDPRRKTLNSEK